jgi:Spy/CpxP family protein refolding chaperone
MTVRTCLTAVAALCLAAIVTAIAQDATTMPSQTEEHHMTHTRIIAPFNLLTDLTDDQKMKIADIHRDELSQERALRQKEQDDVRALLSDDQKKELDDLQARTAAERKAAEEERRAKTAQEKAEDAQQKAENMGGATTQPSAQ